MNKYRLGNKIIETTEEVYNARFKEIGYVPFKEEKEEVKEVKRTRKTIKED